MKRTVKVTRPSSGTGTVVTVTLTENGVTATFQHKSSASSIKADVTYADKRAREMLADSMAAIDALEPL